jgi:type III pantothenate kinase
MLLAIDIGNTNTTLGVFSEEKLIATWHIDSNLHRTADEYSLLIVGMLNNRGIAMTNIEDIVICSVVPPLTATFEEISEYYFHLTPLKVGTGVKTGVRIRMDNPREVGSDRIVNAASAHYLYPGPVIVVDFSTAITFDTISRDGDYLGGAIAPGISTAVEALFMRTSMLPRVEVVAPKRAIGTNTVAALQSGIVFGYIGLIEGIVTRIQQELGEKAKVIATGGYAKMFAKEVKIIDEVNPWLTLIGLRVIYHMTKNQPPKTSISTSQKSLVR